jgi:uncharacterized alpha-E superfamily protein
LGAQGAFVVISRIADHCFWFGRYLERAEATARLLYTTKNLVLDSELTPAQCWRPVVVVSGEERQFRERFAPSDDDPAWGDAEVVERFMTWDDENASALARSVSSARWNARQMREVVSLEAWQTTNELHLYLTEERGRQEFDTDRYGFYRHVRTAAQLCLGQVSATMLHDEPLDFIWLGALLERASQTARILDVHHHAFSHIARSHVVLETGVWLSLLRSLSGFEPFMKRHRGRVEPVKVAAFLVTEARFPRSLRFSVQKATARLRRIRPPDAVDRPGGSSIERLTRLDAHLASAAERPLDDAELHALLTFVVDETHAICGLIGEELFGQRADVDTEAAGEMLE